MFFSGFPEFNIDDLTGLGNNNYCEGNLDFDGSNWYLSNVAGPSQPYVGVDVQGDLNNYPDFATPLTAPTSLDPTHGIFSNEGYNSPFYQGSAMPSFSPQPATTPSPLFTCRPLAVPSPVPTLSHGSSSLSPQSYTVPVTPTYPTFTQPWAVPNPDDLDFGFPAAVGSSSLPMIHPPPVFNTSYEEELWRQCSQSDALCFGMYPLKTITGVTSPEIPLPAPIASSSGPQRTRQSARVARRHDPTKSAKQKADSKKDGWDQTLVRFRTELDTLYSVHNGQPSGGLEPEMALAKIDKFIKEDLKRSPLQNTKAGEGRRSRDVEDYLKGLLKVIRQMEPTPIQAGGESDENNTTVAALSRLADKLEAKLAAVNQQPALRQSPGTPKTGQSATPEPTGKQVKKNGTEKVRRNTERHHLERISRLFKAPRDLWPKKDVLSLVVMFLLYGSEAFPRNFIETRSTAPWL